MQIKPSKNLLHPQMCHVLPEFFHVYTDICLVFSITNYYKATYSTDLELFYF